MLCVPWYVIPATDCGGIATDGFPGGLVAWSQEFTLITEQTLRAAASCQGVGLHSGAPVNLQILPAPASTGIIFRRVDLDGFEIEAVGKNVARVSYATSLMKKGVLISTTEHLLSCAEGVSRKASTNCQ